MPVEIETIGCLTGIAPWKRRRIRRMLANRHGPRLASSPARAVAIARANGGSVACWNSRMDPQLPEMAREAGVDLLTIEDGFIRSAGLGAALTQPCSILIDRHPHYDSSFRSDLEILLQEKRFSGAEIDRASVLVETIRRRGITKYFLRGAEGEVPQGRRIVLVIGQVEDDLSVLLGGCGKSMAQFVDRVRQLEPDALIVFKPHPDVVSGLRKGQIGETEGIVVSTADICDLFERVDAVHTLTSLAGFEALLRGKEVVVHGQPFYSGWGLTRDIEPLARRTRTLSLAELVAGVLIDYPVYCHPRTGVRCSVEELIAALAEAGPAAMPGLWRNLLGRLAGGLGRGRMKPGRIVDAASAII